MIDVASDPIWQPPVEEAEPRYVPAVREREIKRDLTMHDFGRLAIHALRQGQTIDANEIADPAKRQAFVAEVNRQAAAVRAADERRARKAERNRMLAARNNRSA